MNILRRWLRRQVPRTLSSREAYALWADSYPSQPHNALMAVEQEAMLELLPSVPGQTILDLACGTGRYGAIVQDREVAGVIGLDDSRAMLQRAGIKRVTQARMEAVPLADAVVDGVICGLALGHLPFLAGALAEVRRVLKPGGWVLLSDFHPFLGLSGRARTFVAADGASYAVRYHVHLYEDYYAAAGEAGLRVAAVREPRLVLPGTDVAAPAVLVLLLWKT